MIEPQPVKELRPKTIFARVSVANKEFLQAQGALLNMDEGPLINELLTLLRGSNLLSAQEKEAPVAKKKKAAKKAKKNVSKKKPVSKKR